MAEVVFEPYSAGTGTSTDTEADARSEVVLRPNQMVLFGRGPSFGITSKHCSRKQARVSVSDRCESITLQVVRRSMVPHAFLMRRRGSRSPHAARAGLCT